MNNMESVVAVYETHGQAENAVKDLQEGGIDMKSLSIAAKDTHTDEHVVGYYNAGDRMKYWGKMGAFWGGFWGLLITPRVTRFPLAQANAALLAVKNERRPGFRRLAALTTRSLKEAR
jgi:hypothetical protein